MLICFFHSAADLFFQILLADHVFKRCHHIKDHIRMCPASDDPEIMKTKYRINPVNHCCDHFFQFIGIGIIRRNRIHMNDGLAMQLFIQFFFNIINHIVNFQNIPTCRYLCMQRNHESARPVVMHHKIMNSQNTLMLHHTVLNLRHQFCRCRITQQRADRILRCFDSSLCNKQADRHTAVTINIDSSKKSEDRRCQYH